jgi:mxaK protein
MARMMLWRDVLVWILWIVSLGLLSATGIGWYRDAQVNAALDQPVKAIGGGWIRDFPEIQFLNAWQLARKGDTTKALELYTRLATQDMPVINTLARYNMGNLYLQSALDALHDEGAMAYNEASPLLAMAKESYRQSLRAMPENWDARRNMELAQRASPDIMPGIRNEQEQEETEVLTKSTERAWPTIPGFPKGMP